MAKRLKKKETKHLGKRALSLFLALVMCFSMLQIGAFAASDSDKETQAQKQIEGASNNASTDPDKWSPTYYVYNEETEQFETPGTRDAVVHNTGSASNARVTISKTIEATGEENLFDITLSVDTNQKVEQVAEKPDAAVVLVIDRSTSMRLCMECGAGNADNGTAPNDHARTCSSYGKSDYKERLEAAKEAAIEFAGKFAESAKNENGVVEAHRYVALAYFSGSGGIQKINGENWVDAAALTWTKSGSSYLTSNNVLTQAINDIDYPGSGDGTNVALGLNSADTLLGELFAAQASNAKLSASTSFVLLLGDGEPNRTGNISSSGYSDYNTDWSNGRGGYAYELAETWARKIREGRNVKLLTSYVGMDATADGYQWFTAISNQCALANNTNSLMQTFENYLTLIRISAEAWEVTDPMGPYVSYVESVKNGSNVSVSGGTLSWTLRNDIPVVTDAKGNKVDLSDVTADGSYKFHYETTYRVKLDSSNSKAWDYTLTNGATKLEYYLTNASGQNVNDEGEVVTGENALLTMYFKVPKVKGYCGELSFNKAAYHDKSALGGAEFTLTEKTGTVAAISSSSSAAGVVDFTKATGKPIPSGFTYTLKETKAPDGYVKSADTYTVAVRYGEVYVNDEKVTASPWTTIYNDLDPQEGTITLEKKWQQPEGTAKQDVTVELKMVGNSDWTKEVTIPASGSVTVKVPYVNVKTGENATYSMEEQAVSGYKATYSANITPKTAENDAGKTLTVTNTITAESDVTVSKKWNTVSGYETDTYVVLLRNGEVYKTASLTKSDLSETFSNVPTYDDHGVAYTYTVAEWLDADEDGKVDEGELYNNGGTITLGGHSYEVKIEGTTVINNLKQETLTVEGTKTWLDNEDHSKDSVVITLLKNGEPFDSQTVGYNEENGTPSWSYKFTDLDKYDLDNYTVNTYAVTDDVKGYTPVGGTAGDNYNLKNQREQASVTIGVQKDWVDDDDKYGNRPDIYVQLFRDGVAVEDEVVFFVKDGDGTWANNVYYEFEPQAKYDLDTGREYAYTVKEFTVNGDQGVDDNSFALGSTRYTSSMELNEELAEEKNADKAYVITNTLEPNDTSVTLTKHWVDTVTTDKAANRPDAVIKVKGSDGSERTVIFSGSKDTQSVTLVLPAYVNGQEVTYTTNEIVPEGYQFWKDGEWTYYNYPKQDTVTVSGTKTWVGNGVADPEDVTIQLKSDKAVANTFVEIESKKIATADGTFTFSGLPKYAYAPNAVNPTSVREIQYRVTDSVDNYETSGGAPVTDGDGNVTYDLTNTFKQEYVTVSGTKTWVDGNNEQNTRPASITVRLYQDDVEVNSTEVKPNADDEWKYEFSEDSAGNKLPQYKDNAKNEYKYTVKEDAVEDYKTTINGYNIINTLKEIEDGSKGASATVVKTWRAPADLLPNEIVFELWQRVNGQESKVQDVTVTADKDWTATVNELPTMNSSGHKITYFFKEQGVENGVVAVNGKNYSVTQDGNAFVNTIEQESVTVEGAKTWEDAPENAIPDSVYVQLYRDGVSMGSAYRVELSEENDWSYEFQNLDKYALNEQEDGHEIAWTVKEVYEAENAEGESNWIALEENGTFVVKKASGNYTFKVSYNDTAAAETVDGVLTRNVVNTWTETASYLYRVDRVYNYYDADGNLVADSSGKVTGDKEVGSEDQIVIIYDDVADQYKTTDGYASFTYKVEQSTPTMTAAEKSVIGVKLEEPTEYVITLVYEYREVKKPGGGGGGGSDDVNVTVKKVWQDEDSADRPDSVTVQLYRDGEARGEAQTLSAKNDWKYTWYDLSTKYDWTVQEVDVPAGYEATVSHKGNTWTITNSLVEVDIPEEDTPTSGDPELPGDGSGTGAPDVDVPSTDVPKADVPKTGDNNLAWAVMTAVSGMGLVYLAISGKKRKEEEA